MTRSLTISPVGFWHVHADDYAEQVRRHPLTSVGPVWDDDAVRGAEAAARLDVEFEPQLERLLARDDIDGITVTTRTTDHPRVIAAAIRAGKHVFTEKLLAPTVAESEQLVAAAREAGVSLVVSLPRLAEPTTLAAERLIADGALGELTYARVRMAHDGWIGGWLPERFADPRAAVGGALSDLGCHPLYLIQRFLGAEPTSVAASYGSVTGRAVEDNAVVTLGYPNGALGVAEASFVTTPGAFAFELRGTEGSLLYGFGGERMLAKGPHFDADAWTEVALPEPGPTPLEQWVEHALAGTQADENQRAAIDLTRVVVAANAAAVRWVKE